MLQFLKMRIGLIGLAFLALGACADSGGKPGIDAADPGTAPYPNLGAFPAPPARPSAAKRETEEKDLAAQREAAKAFDARLRAIDPVLDPSARPPEPPVVASAAGVQVPGTRPVSAVTAPPQPMPLPAAVPPLATAAASPTQALVVPQPVPPASIAAPIPPPRSGHMMAAVPNPAPIVATGTRASNGWIVGEIQFVDGSVILTDESRRTLRDAVVAAQERGGRVRITPNVGPVLSPPEQTLSPRRAAAASGELEALGLDRARILFDSGALRAARVAVEF